MRQRLGVAILGVLGLVCLGVYWLLSLDAGYAWGHRTVLIALLWGGLAMLLGAAVAGYLRRSHGVPEVSAGDVGNVPATPLEEKTVKDWSGQRRIGNRLGWAAVACTALAIATVELENRPEGGVALFAFVCWLAGLLLFSVAGAFGPRWWFVFPAAQIAIIWYILATLKVGW